MGEIDPRKMALQIAGLRANETHLSEDERVFQDPYAEYFFPAEVRQMVRNVDWVKAERAKYEALMPGVNGALVARIRFMDECLKDALESGFKQLVIVGAGYDTRAYRVPGVKERLKVFEIDHPLTQGVKVDTLKQIFGALPDHVTYVSVEFGKDRLNDKLRQAGYDAGQKTLFIIEGLLMYLPPAAVEGLLAFVCQASGPGSALVADTFSTAVVSGSSPLPEARMLKQFVENEGAVLQFGIGEEKEEAFFKSRGFSRVSRVSTAWCKDKYFKGPSRERTVSPMFTFIHAVV